MMVPGAFAGGGRPMHNELMARSSLALANSALCKTPTTSTSTHYHSSIPRVSPVAMENNYSGEIAAKTSPTTTSTCTSSPSRRTKSPILLPELKHNEEDAIAAMLSLQRG